MAPPIYPEGLEFAPDVSSFRVLEPYRKPRWTEFEDGPPLGRKSGIGRRAHLSYRINFEAPQDFERFRTFVEQDLADGTMRFTMPVWMPATNGYVTKTVQLHEGAYTADPFGLGVSVSFILLVFDW
jgi:hypothetical protein